MLVKLTFKKSMKPKVKERFLETTLDPRLNRFVKKKSSQFILIEKPLFDNILFSLYANKVYARQVSISLFNVKNGKLKKVVDDTYVNKKDFPALLRKLNYN